MRENYYMFLLMLVSVPLAGELKFFPFQSDFRVSFGTTAFFFFLLWLHKIPSIVSGLAVGITVVCFRLALDWYTVDSFALSESLRHHLPSFWFYVTFGGLFTLARVNRLLDRPFLVGILAMTAEIAANVLELTLRSNAPLRLADFGTIAALAMLRSFFVLSFFNMIQLRQIRWMQEQQRKRHAHIVMLVTNLYEESVLLNKTVRHAEDITRRCYDFYRQMKNEGNPYAQQALLLAGQIHEIKKDNQRIYAGLSKMISAQNATDYMRLEELGRIVVRANAKYAYHLGKEIAIQWNSTVPDEQYHIYTTLSLLNNLVSNAVEAIVESGTITITISHDGDMVVLEVADDGPGLKVKDPTSLFNPGFTTKYDAAGQPSTGIGLTYVKEIAERLEGQVSVRSTEEETLFSITLPRSHILKKG